MRKKKLILSFLILTSLSSAGFSSVKNSGQIINSNPSVRGAAMGYAYTANVIDDAFGIFSNPAYVADSPLIGAAYSTLFYDGKSVSEEAVAAFSFLYPGLFYGFNMGIAAVSSLEGNIENEQDCAVYLNLSRQTGFLKIGANAKYINSKFYRETDSDLFTADAGLSATFGMLTVGVAGYNLFGDFKDIFGEKVNPSLSAGASLNFNISYLMFSVEAGAVQKNMSKDQINPRAGLELFYRFLAVRCGYEYDEDLKDKGTVSVGLGLDIKNFILDYAFIADQNESGNGDIHKAALSYRFYAPPRVDNEQYKKQIKFEKQQAKLEKKIRKQQEKIDRAEGKSGKSGAEISKQQLKSGDLPLQPVEYQGSQDEFFAVLAPEGVETKISSDLTATKGGSAVYQPTQMRSNDFDAAAYLIELERSKTPASAKTKDKSAKTKSYSATPHGSKDYDPAKELVSGTNAQKEKAKIKKTDKTAVKGEAKPDFKVTSKEKMKQAELKAKKAKLEASQARIAVEDDEFDAARYILENPGKNKIKQYYVKPSKTSKDEFDAAQYLIEREKRENP